MEIDGEGKAGEVGGTIDGGEKGEKEGRFLLGAPTFEDIGNGRLRCVDTGHELPSKDAEAYGKTKGCRIALIDAALSRKKPPLNMFKPDPLSKSKLICKLTGDTVNKSEEHIWKHVTGRRFLNKLEQKEVEKVAPVPEKKSNKKNSDSSIANGKKGQKKDIVKDGHLETETVAEYGDSEEPEFWIPPVGQRWDFDDGKDRWDSCTSSGLETDDNVDRDGADEADEGIDSGDLSTRTKRMSIAVGPSSFASRKKKSKKNSADHSNDD